MVRYIICMAMIALGVSRGGALAQQKVNPLAINWPTCASGNQIYNIVTNTCIAAGTAANPAGLGYSVQYNNGGAFGGASLNGVAIFSSAAAPRVSTAADTVPLSVSGNAATATTATNLAGGAVGSAPYQASLGTTAFIPSPTTTGTYLYAWQPTGSAIAPSAVSLPSLCLATPITIGCGGTGQTTGIAALNALGAANGSTTIAFGNPFTAPSVNGIINAALYPGSDIGAKINAAWAAAAVTGAELYVPPPTSGGCWAYTTPIVFGAASQNVKVTGATTCLNYTPTTGTALTVNIGTGTISPILQDLILIGSGVGNSTIGIIVGGSNSSGTQNMRLTNVSINSFGTGLELTGGNTFAFVGDQVYLLNNGQNFIDLSPAENVRFIDSIFALNTPGATGTLANCVDISATSSEYTFTNDSFDNCQLAMGSNVQVSIFGGHFENPALTSYDFFTATGTSSLSIISAQFLIDSSTFSNNRIGFFNGGSLTVVGGQAYSPAVLGSFVNLGSSASASITGFNHLSSFSALVSGSTTGAVMQCPDVNNQCDLPASSFANVGTNGLGVNVALSNRAGVQIATGNVCATTAVVLNTCVASMTLPATEPDTSYSISGCVAHNATVAIATGSTGGQTTTGFSVTIYGLTATANSTGTITCLVTH